MTLMLATNNSHKKRELSAILQSHTVMTPEDLDLVFRYEETGNTFLANAKGKADSLFALVQQPVLADDSGLVVPALGGEPGVYSARYGAEAGKRMDDTDRNEYLLRKMTSVTDRAAHFVCCMVFVVEPDRFFVAQETFHGEILTAPTGSGGFGYDPVFYVPEYAASVAELPAETKNSISHRGKAMLRIRDILTQLERETEGTRA